MMIKDGSPLRDGFFLGTYTSRINSSGKLILVSPFIKPLKEPEIKDLWCYPDPTSPRIILCPSWVREQYIKLAIENFPSTGDPEDHFRKYIFSGTSYPIDFFKRVQISPHCLSHANISPRSSVTLLGMGPWIEIFS
jgi:DNA-binding transcriptional regulator/RsmH inhibitor MraZ